MGSAPSISCSLAGVTITLRSGWDWQISAAVQRPVPTPVCHYVADFAMQCNVM